MFFPLGSKSAVHLMTGVVQVPESLISRYQNHAGWGLYNGIIRNTAGMMAIMPLIIMYLFCQRYLVQGIERSGLVG
jgi:ABC-type glycerol-3-phosphate transport system permease component